MDWHRWKPHHRAVLCFIVREGRVLLIHKKRGLGAGKVNAPGGKLEAGETPREAAIRETQEEICVTPHGLEQRGILRFQFTDGYSLECTVFMASGCEGEPRETDEATPFWSPLDAVPYDAMWEDDRHWLPLALVGTSVSAFFEFEGERMLSKLVHTRRLLIAGCGFLGLALARRASRAGWCVTGVTHSAESAAAIAGEPLVARECDLSVPAEVETLGAFDAVVHCASSGRGGAEAYRRVYVEGARNLLAALRVPLVFASSTSVYAQVEGEWVTEESPAEPPRETGGLLREAEEIALASGGVAARLAGLYGPARSVLLRKFLAGEAVIEGDGRRWLNQIHREDAASALLHLLEHGARGIYNVSDDSPISQRDLYERLAAHFQRPLPPPGPIDTHRKRGWTHKRVSNAKLRALGWQPEYASFFAALAREGESLAAP
jgi:nucleoside-diphosphate-sugar epimerase/8-oxo-dGTP pyrophosphatase MutT (NUDIX family)